VIQFGWDPIDDAAEYQVSLRTFNTTLGSTSRVLRISTTGTQWTFDLTSSVASEVHWLEIVAVSEAGVSLGELRWPYLNGYGWAYGFRVVGSVEPTAGQTAEHVVGDSDGFGLGMAEGGVRSVGNPVFDNREPDDPGFTDHWPAGTEIEYEHSVTVPEQGVATAAYLELFTLGIQDGDSQVLGSNTDIELFVDGIVVPAAFDDIDQFISQSDGFFEIAGTVRIDLPSSVLAELNDGHAVIRIVTNQLGSAPSYDAFSIDYSRMHVEY
jgi:hypothetical protein